MYDPGSDLSVDPNRVIAWRIDRLRDAGFPLASPARWLATPAAMYTYCWI